MVQILKITLGTSRDDLFKWLMGLWEEEEVLSNCRLTKSSIIIN
jgi:hypothetical protein